MFLVLYKPSMAAQVGVMLVLHSGGCWSETGRITDKPRCGFPRPLQTNCEMVLQSGHTRLFPNPFKSSVTALRPPYATYGPLGLTIRIQLREYLRNSTSTYVGIRATIQQTCATNWTVSGSIPSGVTGDFFRSYRQNHLPWDRLSL
jgi:hypothetical protein